MKTKTPLLTKLAYSTAVSLACFSGGVATWGMMKLVPGAEIVVGGLGLLFEAGKLSSFALLHRPLPRLMKIALASVGAVLMTANIVGVSGFLSASYERSQIHAAATSHASETTAHAAASLTERMLAAAESNLSQARAALIKARDDKGRQRAAQAIVASAAAERDNLVRQMGTAQQLTATAEGSTIESGSEFAAIQFIAGATGTSSNRVAHGVIFTLAAIPDVLALLLLLAP